MKTTSAFLYPIVLLLVACQFTERHADGTTIVQTITLQPFADLPEAIDGCSCLFSENSTAFRNGDYLYADNMQDTGFVKLGGRLLKVVLESTQNGSNLEIRTVGKGDSITVQLDLRKSDQMDYVGSYFGTLEVETTDGKTYKQTVFGECGC